MTSVKFKHHILGLGSPLLDYIVEKPDLLVQYDLKDDDAVLATEKHESLFTYLLDLKNPLTVPGGCSQNTLRYAQYYLTKQSKDEYKDYTTFIGSVGSDDNGKIDHAAEMLRDGNKEAGVESCYRTKKGKTGVCASIVKDTHRSMVARLGAATQFSVSDVEFFQEQNKISKATLMYLEGFFICEGLDAMLKLGEIAADTNKILFLNMSAPYVVSGFYDNFKKILFYADYVIGNESEALAYAEKKGIGKDLQEIAKDIAAAPKKNVQRNRIVIITSGSKPIIVAENGREVLLIDVPKMETSQIKDTIGAGDAFAAGLLAGICLNKSLKDNVNLGIELAQLCMQQMGAQTPPK